MNQRLFRAAQWLRLHTSNAGGKDLILGQGTKVLHAAAKIEESRAITKNQFSQISNFFKKQLYVKKSIHKYLFSTYNMLD